MLCFEFIGDGRIELLLCEEAIRYSAVRGEGVQIGATVIVKNVPAEDPYLYAIHRRALSHIRMAPRDSWTDRETGFPYSHIFKSISDGRLSLANDGAYIFQFAATDDDATRVTLLPDSSARKFCAIEQMANGESADPDAPFSLVRLGPFPPGNGPFLFRFEFTVSGSSYDDLVPEYQETATRLYRVYGPEHIRRDIPLIDIPQALARHGNERFQKHAEFFDSIPSERRIVAQRYSIVAVDNLNCNPARLRCIDLTSDLRDMTDAIDASVYDHPYLSAISGRIHWFVSERPSRRFYLQLSGPMSIDDLLGAASTNHAA